MYIVIIYIYIYIVIDIFPYNCWVTSNYRRTGTAPFQKGLKKYVSVKLKNINEFTRNKLLWISRHKWLICPLQQ